MRTVDCACKCGGTFQTDKPNSKYIAGHNPTQYKKPYQFINGKKHERRQASWWDQGEVTIYPPIETIMQTRPLSCDKCGSQSIGRDDIYLDNFSHSIAEVAKIEWKCLMCSRRFHGVNLQQIQSIPEVSSQQLFLF